MLWCRIRLWRRGLGILAINFIYFLFLFLLVFYFFYSGPDLASFDWPIRSHLSDSNAQRIADIESQKRKSLPKEAPEPKTFWNYQKETSFKNVTIVMWTKYYGNDDLPDHIRNESPIPDWCNVTSDKRLLNESDAIVFHVLGSDYEPKDLPPRNPAQIWIFFRLESPAYTSIIAENINGLFNRTMTYR